jgi:large subunit ribosomal protein L13
MKTYMDKSADMKHAWHIVDAKGRILGQVASEIAVLLMGKHKPTFTPHMDNGDFVVVLNAKEVAVTGNKVSDKMYFDYSGFPGGLRKQTFAELHASKPEQIIERAVWNMLPKNKQRDQRMKRLKVYAGSEHPHQSQLGGKSEEKAA